MTKNNHKDSTQQAPARQDTVAVMDDGNACVHFTRYQVATILHFLSQSDIALGASGEGYNSSGCFGRSNILAAMTSCVEQFEASDDKQREVADRLREVIQSHQIRDQAQTDLHDHYLSLLELPDDTTANALAQLKMKINRLFIGQWLQETLGLNQSDALVIFKLAVVDQPDNVGKTTIKGANR